jgi:hypothetical protein
MSQECFKFLFIYFKNLFGADRRFSGAIRASAGAAVQAASGNARVLC